VRRGRSGNLQLVSRSLLLFSAEIKAKVSIGEIELAALGESWAEVQKLITSVDSTVSIREIWSISQSINKVRISLLAKLASYCRVE